MGIINTTPDSFYDGGKYNSIEKIIQKVEKDLSNNATFIDIGGHSTKPNAKEVSEDEELKRTIPVIEAIIKRFPDVLISIDTFRGKIAQEALLAGAAMINDISAWELDKNMFNVITQFKVPYVLMHMQGTPKTMQDNPNYENVTKDIIYFISKKVAKLQENNVLDIIIDPGFGFGKSLDNNYEIMGHLKYFYHLNYPILSGISRKSMIYKLLNTNSLNSINGTTALNMYALLNGAKILRVHDTEEANECIQIFNKITHYQT